MVQSICRVMDGRLVILLDPGAGAFNDFAWMPWQSEFVMFMS